MQRRRSAIPLLSDLVELERLDPEVARLLRRKEHSLLSILELTNELTVSLDPYEIADLVLFNLMGHLGTPRSCIWLLSRGAAPSRPSGPVLLRAYGIPTEKASAIGSICGRRLVRSMEEEGQPMGLEAVLGSLDPVDRALVERAGLDLFAPVHCRGTMLGLVGLGSRVGGVPYEPVDKQVIQSSLCVLGVALENTSLYSNLAEKNRQLEGAFQRLKEADRLKSEFLRNVNHELRTPLTVIIGYAQWLLSETEAESRREFFETILSEGQKLNALVEKLLDLSAVAEDALDIQPRPIAVDPILEQLFMNRHLGITESLREFRYAPEAELPEVIADPRRVMQILEAFVDNAVKFTPEGSRIWLETERLSDDSGDWLRIDVRDNGPGVDPDRIDEIFIGFHQGDGSVSRAQGGLGIGLALARQLAEGMGGRVEAASAPGRGAMFSLYLRESDAGSGAGVDDRNLRIV